MNEGQGLNHEPTTLLRDCPATQVPFGNPVVLPEGTEAIITQSLGGTYTIHVPAIGGLFRVAGGDADALGLEVQPAAPAVELAATDAATAVTEPQVWDVLREVYDPEIPVNIVDLGLIYDLRVEPHPQGGSRVVVQMTLTAPGCGMGPLIARDAESRVGGLPGVTEASVRVVWDPPWTPHMMSEAAKEQLGFM